MKPDMVPTSSLQELICTLDIRFYKRARIDNRIVVMRLCSVMNNDVVPRYQLIKKIRIANITNNQLNPTFRQASNAIWIRGIGQFV